ncbi:unnamed protein product [Pleuronectes platessa]|uniref:Uncharacterized protein n=1 Tax=Pleuronectes platessa TaxID=8262 RepID=A0A9N7TQH1_PLEPL|nr:unnamed protein product [Pleuronectes platessa]
MLDNDNRMEEGTGCSNPMGLLHDTAIPLSMNISRGIGSLGTDMLAEVCLWGEGEGEGSDCEGQTQGLLMLREKGGGHGERKNTWYQFWSDGFRRVHICCGIETLASLPPSMSNSYMGGRNMGAQRETPLQSFHLQGKTSAGLAEWFVPSLPRARPRTLPAYHYKASGPYCITDGADRRERRQPACFLER